MDEKTAITPEVAPEVTPEEAAAPKGPVLPQKPGDSLIIKDNGRKVELIVLARSIADLKPICEAQGLRYLDATRFNHGTGAAADGNLQIPVYVRVKAGTDEPEAVMLPVSSRQGLAVVDIDAWYWLVKASKPKAEVVS